ncbi:sugar phosphate isomerase/epimerase family protein [Amycolatopsis sp. NPDC051903]|uniref:sugar phosphate isomerase/epimerase family protein n=1 Tax=Amycolatopsis sp. NPDC051903 TaxID=3363936 RepID=UPI0037889D2B
MTNSVVPEPLVLSQGSFLDISTPEFLKICADSGMAASVWDIPVHRDGADVVLKAAEDLGVELFSMCRLGYFTEEDPDEARWRSNLAVLDTAARLGIGTIVVVVGAVTTTFAEAGSRIRAGLERILSHAQERGVRLAIEPFHPMMAAERSSVCRLAQATALAQEFASEWLGIALDVYHVWWDPNLAESVRAAGPHVMAVDLSDWLVPTTNLLRGRGRPGDGVIDLPGFVRLVDSTGYTGRWQVEVLSDEPREGSDLDYALDLRERTSRLLTNAR